MQAHFGTITARSTQSQPLSADVGCLGEASAVSAEAAGQRMRGVPYSVQLTGSWTLTSLVVFVVSKQCLSRSATRGVELSSAGAVLQSHRRGPSIPAVLWGVSCGGKPDRPSGPQRQANTHEARGAGCLLCLSRVAIARRASPPIARKSPGAGKPGSVQSAHTRGRPARTGLANEQGRATIG